MLLVAPTDVVALNFFFDTLLFCGAILLLANSIDKEPANAESVGNEAWERERIAWRYPD